MVVWETSKDEVNHLNSIIELQRNMIDILVKNNNYLYDQLNTKKENDKLHSEYDWDITKNNALNNMIQKWSTFHPHIKFPIDYMNKQEEGAGNENKERTEYEKLLGVGKLPDNFLDFTKIVRDHIKARYGYDDKNKE